MIQPHHSFSFFSVKSVISHVAAICFLLVCLIPSSSFGLCANFAMSLDTPILVCSLVIAAFYVLVAVLAVRCPKIQSAIFSVRYKFQMPWINALPVTAFVMALQRRWNSATKIDVSSAIHLGAAKDLSIAMCVSGLGQRSEPIPTTSRFIQLNALSKVGKQILHGFKNANPPTESEVCAGEAQQSVSRLEIVCNHLATSTPVGSVTI